MPDAAALTLREMGRNPNDKGEILDAVALLVIDMQDAFLDAIPDGRSITERCAFAIEAARLFGIDTIFTEQVPEKLGRTTSALRNLAPNARVFSKNTFPALAAPGLMDHLKRRGIYHLIIVGIETPICVYQTALQAQDADLDVTIISDAVGGRRSEDCRTVIDALARSSAHVLPAEAIFYSMLGSTAHPRFRDFTRLVKHYNGPEPLASRPELGKTQRADEPRQQTPTDETSAPSSGESTSGSSRRRRRRGRRGRRQESPQEPGTTQETATPATTDEGAKDDDGRKKDQTSSTPRTKREESESPESATPAAAESAEPSPVAAVPEDSAQTEAPQEKDAAASDTRVDKPADRDEAATDAPAPATEPAEAATVETTAETVEKPAARKKTARKKTARKTATRKSTGTTTATKKTAAKKKSTTTRKRAASTTTKKKAGKSKKAASAAGDDSSAATPSESSAE